MRNTRSLRAIALFAIVAVLCGAASAVLGTCGPFTDVAADAFCPFVLEIFYLGITTGTTATTYDPASNVTRLQMAAFLSRTVDGALKRGSRRAALDQFWTSQNTTVLGTTTVGVAPGLLASDGADIWVAVDTDARIARVRASDGKLLETWTGATSAFGVLVAMGRVFSTGFLNPGQLYRIDPGQPAGAVTTVATNLGGSPQQLTFDGQRLWTANSNGSVSIVTPGPTLPWTVTTVTTGGFLFPLGAVFDGSNVWIADNNTNFLYKLDSAGAILQTVTVGLSPAYPVFDGSNIWVPLDNQVAVVRSSNGALLATLTGNGLSTPQTAAFDGQRVLVTNFSGGSVSLFKAADLSPLGSFTVGSFDPVGSCSDGVSFWVGLAAANRIVRF